MKKNILKQKRQNKKINIITLILLYTSVVYCQNIKILKDSVFIDKTFFELQELKIALKKKEVNEKIYNIIQNTFPIFDKPLFDTPENRIKAKKDSIYLFIKENRLRESNVGFEHYKIYYDKNNLINISIEIQSYGSAWEDIQYFCFDLNNGKRIGINFFVNQQILLRKIRKKIKQQDINLSVKQNDLLNFKFITDKNKTISGIDFLIFDTENYRNSGYEAFTVHFEWREIKKYISPIFEKRLTK